MNSKDALAVIEQLEAGLSQLRELVRHERRKERDYYEDVEYLSPQELLQMPGFRIGDGIQDVDWDDLSEEEQRDLEEFADVLYEGKKSRERNTKIYDLAVRQAEAEEELEVAMVKLSAAIADFTESRRRSMPAASRIILAAAAVYEAAGLLEDLEEKKEEVIYD